MDHLSEKEERSLLISKLNGVSLKIFLGGLLASTGCMSFLAVRLHTADSSNPNASHSVMETIMAALPGVSPLVMAFYGLLAMLILYGMVLDFRRPSTPAVAAILEALLTFIAVPILMAVLGVCFLDKDPINHFQNVWVVAVIGSILILAFGLEPRSNTARNENEKWIITGPMLKFIVGHVVFQMAVLVALVYFGDRLLGIPSNRFADMGHSYSQHYTIVFNVFTLMSLFTWFNARFEYADGFKSKWWRTPSFLAYWASLLICHVLIVQASGHIFSLTPLSISQWIFSVVLSALIVPFGLILSLIPPLGQGM